LSLTRAAERISQGGAEVGKKIGRVGLMALSGTLVASGCSFGPTYDDWATTTGAVGAINMDEVLGAFRNARSTADFERQVNQIYEGDGLVLVRVSRDGDRELLEGFEDLNRNNRIDASGDDLVFSIVREGDTNRLQGHGVNGYYSRPFGGGGLLFGYIIGSSLSRQGVIYQTPQRDARGSLARQRASYRSSPRYSSQLSRNTAYFSRQPGFSGSKYVGRTTNVGSNRTSYMGAQKASGSFRSSGTQSRSGFGKVGSRGGGARGGGGAQVLIGGIRG
jgi:hypothetical protein